MKAWERRRVKVRIALDRIVGYKLTPCPLVCCIYHKPKAFDESSGESSDSASSGPDSPISDTSESSHTSAGSGVNASKSLQARKVKAKDKGGQCKESHDHNHSPEHNHSHGKSRRRRKAEGSSTLVETQEEMAIDDTSSKPIPNAYERGD